ALVNRGAAFARQGELERALADFDAVLEHFPGLPLARMNRGNLLAQLGQIERARADLDFACRAGAAPACAALRGMRGR
ncbi:MAG: tetratricopeptide repeat protein, partial [Burkholderiales bacterium]